MSVVLVFLSSCGIFEYIHEHDRKMCMEHYSPKENYVRVTGTVDFINRNEDFTKLYIGFSETSPAIECTCCVIVGKNLETVKANQIMDNLKIGKKIDFVTVPEVLWDGYTMPVAALSIDGETLLDFEEGYENLLLWVSEDF